VSRQRVDPIEGPINDPTPREVQFRIADIIEFEVEAYPRTQ
jgi:hypothetical protein